MTTYLQRRGREVRQQQLDFLASQRQQDVKVCESVRCDHLQALLLLFNFNIADQLLIRSHLAKPQWAPHLFVVGGPAAAGRGHLGKQQQAQGAAGSV